MDFKQYALCFDAVERDSQLWGGNWGIFGSTEYNTYAPCEKKF